VIRLFGNTLLVILAYLGNSKLSMARRPCVIGGIDTVISTLERLQNWRRTYRTLDAIFYPRITAFYDETATYRLRPLLQKFLVILYVDITLVAKFM